MGKISSKTEKSLFLKLTIKSLISSIVCIAVLSALCSFIMLKLDIDTEYNNYFALFICGVSAFASAYISLSDFKNNYLLVSVISVLPLILFSLINGIINKTGVLFIIVKLIVISSAAILSAVIRIARKRR